jgi:HAD superfamily hydrolase (TIGR01490 family)
MMEREKTLALFDFDGTIARKDTLFEIIKYICGTRKFYIGVCALSPYFFLYLCKILSSAKLKERVLMHFFRGMSIDTFNRHCCQFAKEIIPSLIRKDALEMINKLKAQKADIAIVTASAENWVAPWCNDLNATCIGTRLEVKNGCITGKIEGNNCNGLEKVNRIKGVFNLLIYNKILAFGDTYNDLPMLHLATSSYYRFFSN